jgi:hypothetical protein
MRGHRHGASVALVILGIGFLVEAITFDPCPPGEWCIFTHWSMPALVAIMGFAVVLVGHVLKPSRTPKPTADGVAIGDRLIPWWTVITARWVRRTSYGEVVVLRVSKAGRRDDVWLPRDGTVRLHPSDYGMPAEALIAWIVQLAAPHNVIVLTPLERGEAR